MTPNEGKPAPERIFIPRERNGWMHYQWSEHREDFEHWETVDPDWGDEPRGTVVEYVRADLAAAALEKERIIEFLRSSAKTLEESGSGSWSTATEEDKACSTLLECMARLIEDGSWVETLAHQKAMRRRATLKIVQ